MSADIFKRQNKFARQNVPMVLALVSHRADEAREKLLMLLARSCQSQGGRVLVVEHGADPSSLVPAENKVAAPDFDGFPGNILQGGDGIFYAGIPDATPAEMFVALDNVAGTPPRFDLVLLHVKNLDHNQLFLASLAQRVLVVSMSQEGTLDVVREKMEWLAGEHLQRHFSLALDAGLMQARQFYRDLMESSSVLLQVECNLLESLPPGLYDKNISMEKFVEQSKDLALLDTLWRDVQPLETRGGLQIFWRCILFCSDCSLKLCRDMLASGKRLDVCPVHRF